MNDTSLPPDSPVADTVSPPLAPRIATDSPTPSLSTPTPSSSNPRVPTTARKQKTSPRLGGYKEPVTPPPARSRATKAKPKKKAESEEPVTPPPAKKCKTPVKAVKKPAEKIKTPVAVEDAEPVTPLPAKQRTKVHRKENTAIVELGSGEVEGLKHEIEEDDEDDGGDYESGGLFVAP